MMNSKRCFTFLLFLTAITIADASPSWQTLTSPNFKIISQLNEKDTRAWAHEFSMFIDALQNIFPVDKHRLTPLTIILFASDKEFKQYKMKRPDGNTSDALRGYFFTLEAWSIIGIAKMADNEATRRTVYHEAVHWYMNADPRHYPLWFMEGMAETFSTFVIKNNQAKLGTVIDQHITVLNTKKMLPVEKLIAVQRQDEIFNNELKTSLFYAQSWALVHFLIFGDHDSSHTFMKLYRDALNTDHPDEALLNYFGKDFKRTGIIIEQYAKNGMFHYGRIDLESPAEYAFNLRVASEAEVYAALSRLAFASNQFDLARMNAEKVIQLSPDKPSGYELQVLISSAVKNYNLLQEAFNKARASGSRDAWTMILAANSLWETFNTDSEQSMKKVRQIANLYKKAISFQPFIISAYKNCARVLLNTGSFESDDLKIIKQGNSLFPRQGDILLCEAYLTYSDSTSTAAIRLLDSAMAVADLEPQLRNGAQTLKRNWILNYYIGRVNQMISDLKFTDAIAFVDDGIKKTNDTDLKIKLQELRHFIMKQFEFFSR